MVSNKWGCIQIYREHKKKVYDKQKGEKLCDTGIFEVQSSCVCKWEVSFQCFVNKYLKKENFIDSHL